MRESAVECLMFTQGGRGDGATLVAAVRERGMRVTWSAEPRECLDLFGTRQWCLLILDASGDAPGALDVLSRARDTYPDVPALVLVRRGDVHAAVCAMKAGATHCMEMPVEAAGLPAAIAPLCRPPGENSEEPWVRLTPVEQIVLSHVLEGHTSRQIADALCRSPRTIEVHRRHVMEKLKAGSLVELVREMMRVGGLGDHKAGRRGDGMMRPDAH